MRALVQATLVAHDLARVERRAAPRGRLGGVTVEAAAAEVLRLLARGVVGVLHGQARVRGHVHLVRVVRGEMRGVGEVRVGGGEVRVHVRRGGGGAAVEDTGLRGDHEGRGAVLKLDLGLEVGVLGVRRGRDEGVLVAPH